MKLPIPLQEQHTYSSLPAELEECIEKLDTKKGIYSRSIRIPRYKNDEPVDCYKLDCAERKLSTSYFIGVDWLLEGQLAIQVRPKLDNETYEVDYLKMLVEALKEPENIQHLEGLLHIDFDKTPITLSQTEDLLSPFLITQFLQILKTIVKKGLKKAYYPVQEILNTRIKGKILIAPTNQQNMRKCRFQHVCRYQEYGIDHPENRLLKKAFDFSKRALNSYHGLELHSLKQLIKYIAPAFDRVSDNISIQQIKQIRTNPLFAEYTAAIKLAKLILRRYSYAISRIQTEQVATPPFWIDMSKLFELYVFKQLRQIFSPKEVKYHLKVRRQELDFILKPQHWISPFIIDTKYKPRYNEHSIALDDIRQISGYARLKKVYAELGLSDKHDQNIKCLIIYSHQDCDEKLPLSPSTEATLKEENSYTHIYKLGIRLPKIQKKNP